MGLQWESMNGVAKLTKPKNEVGMVLLTASILLTVSPATAADDYEKPPKIMADEVFSDVPLKGERYRVRSKVPTDGFLTRAEIESDFGEFIAVGPGMLAIRIHEIEALVKLEKFEDSEEFQRGAKESAAEKKDGLQQLKDNPKETLSGVGEGVGRFFKRTARSVKTGVQTAGDVLNEEMPGAVEDGPGASLPGGALSPEQRDTESKYAKVARASGDVALNVLGFDDARRRLAKRLSVDPYTTNRVLDEKLDEVTKSIFAGDLAIDIATSLIPGGRLVSTSNMVTNWVWDTPPGDLRVKIEKSLQAIGVVQQDIDRLLRHRWYPLSFQAVLTNALESLGEVGGRTDIMPLVLSVTTFDQARFVINTLRMTVRYHETVRSIKSLEVLGTIIAYDRDGKIIVTAPIDFLSWIEPIDNFSGYERFADGTKELHIAGGMTERARSNLQQRGWEISENSELLVRISQTSDQ